MSINGIDWITVAVIAGGNAWEALEVDLSEFAGRPVLVRVVARRGV